MKEVRSYILELFGSKICVSDDSDACHRDRSERDRWARNCCLEELALLEHTADANMGELVVYCQC